MENKEIKNAAAKLNDEALENMNGGLLKTIILNAEDGMIGKKLELNDDALEGAAGGCEYHDSNFYAAQPPCVRCAYKYMELGKPCPCCGASWEEQLGGF